MVITQDEWSVTIDCPDCVFSTVLVHEHPENLCERDDHFALDYEV